MVWQTVKGYIDNVASLETLLKTIDQSSINRALIQEYSDHIADNERRLDQIMEFKAHLYESLVSSEISKEDYANYRARYTRQIEEIKASIRLLKDKLEAVKENRSERIRWINHFTKFSEQESIDRTALIHMVESIRVLGKQELKITFRHEDEYQKAAELIFLAQQVERKAG